MYLDQLMLAHPTQVKKKKCETEKFNLYMAIERLFVSFVALLVMPSGSLWQQIHFIQFLTNCQWQNIYKESEPEFRTKIDEQN